MSDKIMKRVPIKHAKVLCDWAVAHHIDYQIDYYSLYAMLYLEMWPNEYINRPRQS